MIKGCQKRVIVLNDTRSKYFDSVCFTLKAELPRQSRRSDILNEARSIINSAAPICEMPKHSDGILAYFSGVATTAGAIALVAYFII